LPINPFLVNSIYMEVEWKDMLNTAQTINECLKIKDTLLASDFFSTLQKQLIETQEIQQKKHLGAQLNAYKLTLKNLTDERIQLLQAELNKDTFAVFDPTLNLDNLPPSKPGVLHPITQTIQDIVTIFSKMGFDIQDGPQVLTQWENFDSVNVPEFHPARDLQDTFFLDAKDKEGRNYVMRTQATSNFAAYAKSHTPPFRTIFPSITFRNETIDATHEVNFHQFDMWLVDKNVSISDLIGLMNYFFREFFGSSDIKVRLRPSFYPFVQPGFDTDIFVPWLKGGVWLEVAGSGLIHRKVLEMNGINPDEWQGMAWGFGVDRLFMIKHNLNFISQVYSGNLTFLKV
jgi:phenylalanyl-tRNA synthetase alpha chain